jgi:hypothetical protein
MDEGVDPTHMCQALVDKVTRSRQLMAVTDPEILTLFEDWLEELEEEVISWVKKSQSLDPAALAQQLGLSLPGATFFLTKLTREGKL